MLFEVLLWVWNLRIKEAKNMDSCDSHGRSTYNDGLDVGYDKWSISKPFYHTIDDAGMDSVLMCF